jgi:hypothetical protein
MELPKNFKVHEGDLKRNISADKPSNQPYMLKLEKNLYGLKEGRLTWFKHLGLIQTWLKQSRVLPLH